MEPYVAYSYQTLRRITRWQTRVRSGGRIYGWALILHILVKVTTAAVKVGDYFNIHPKSFFQRGS